MQQRFIDKFLHLFIALILIKFVLTLVALERMGLQEFLKSVGILIFIGILFGLIVTALKSAATSAGPPGSGSSVLLEESLFDKLRKKYESHAEQYRQQGQYLKASGIYLRLLQNPHRAALVLEEGGLYHEAAVVYLKKLSDKQNAAQCYEKGKNYKKAIELYKDLGNKEKAGDLYLLVNDRTAAYKCYESLIEDYTGTRQYVKASLVARHKMQDPVKARNLLMKGWNNNADAFNCVNNYFASFTDKDELKKAINDIYADTPEVQKEILLTALKYEFAKGKEMEETTRDIAYEIIASCIQKKPSIALEMKDFNPSDKVIIKDIIRYKAALNSVIANNVSRNKERK
jgi:tetratricopeptide (TPR) repeat protein